MKNLPKRILEIRNWKLQIPSLPGFTLVELLVVIGVLGVLATGLLVAINPQAQLAKARNAARKNSLKQIADAVERYKIANGTYPVTSTWCGAAGSYWAGGCTGGGTNWVPGLVASGELKSLPQDPRVGQSFAPCNDGAAASFIYYSNGADFKVSSYCGMEGPYNASDPFNDPVRQQIAWAVYSPGAAGW